MKVRKVLKEQIPREFVAFLERMDPSKKMGRKGGSKMLTGKNRFSAFECPLRQQTLEYLELTTNENV